MVILEGNVVIFTGVASGQVQAISGHRPMLPVSLWQMAVMLHHLKGRDLT
jgi:hypothetical protein